MTGAQSVSDRTVVDTAKPTCPVCASGGTHFANRGEFEVYRCNECALLFTFPVPRQADLTENYKTVWSVGGDQTYTPRRGTARRLRFQMRARQLRKLSSGKSLLEIGCSQGDFLRGAAKAGFSELLGIEPCVPEARYTRSLGFDVRDSALEDTELTDRQFDVVVTRHVIEHVEDPVAFLSKAAEALKPGGILMLETPCSSHFKARRAGPDWRYMRPPWHLNLFDETSLSAIFEKCGFEPLSYRRHLRKAYMTALARRKDVIPTSQAS